MKPMLFFIALLFQATLYGQNSVTISFKNDYEDVYRLSLIIYTPDGKNQTRVGDLKPGQVKAYSFPAGTEIFVADRKQEAFAMKGNDIKTTGVKPSIILTESKDDTVVTLSSFADIKKSTN